MGYLGPWAAILEYPSAYFQRETDLPIRSVTWCRWGVSWLRVSRFNTAIEKFEADKLEVRRTKILDRYGVTGLPNPGNLCFMNSSLQLMAHYIGKQSLSGIKDQAMPSDMVSKHTTECLVKSREAFKPLRKEAIKVWRCLNADKKNTQCCLQSRGEIQTRFLNAYQNFTMESKQSTPLDIIGDYSVSGSRAIQQQDPEEFLGHLAALLDLKNHAQSSLIEMHRIYLVNLVDDKVIYSRDVEKGRSFCILQIPVDKRNLSLSGCIHGNCDSILEDFKFSAGELEGAGVNSDSNFGYQAIRTTHWKSHTDALCTGQNFCRVDATRD